MNRVPLRAGLLPSELDALLTLRGSSRVSTFTWLRSPPGAPTAQSILLHIERLQHIRSLELRSDLGQLIHQNPLLQLAREGATTTAQHLARFDDPRRYGTLVAVLLEASSTLTDEVLDLHDRFVGSIFNKARRKRDEALSSYLILCTHRIGESPRHPLPYLFVKFSE